VWCVVEVVQLHRDHTPRWPTKFTPAAPAILHHVRGRYRFVLLLNPGVGRFILVRFQDV
jgi:hypothetical protein